MNPYTLFHGKCHPKEKIGEGGILLPYDEQKGLLKKGIRRNS